jgi:hypothetical protein
MNTISPLIQGLIDFKKEHFEQKDVSPLLTFQDSHPITQKAANLYEKLRNAVDYSEQGQIRRRAIERLLKRQIIFQSGNDIGKNLLEELITSGYIDSSMGTIMCAKNIDLIVKKYSLLTASQEGNTSFKNWVRSMAAIEIYRFMFPNAFDQKAVETWIEILKSSFVVDSSIEEVRYTRSLYFASLQTLLEQSDPELQFAAFKKDFTEWFLITEQTVDQQVPSLSDSILEFTKSIDAYVQDPLVWYISKKIKNSRISFDLIKEVIEQKDSSAESILSDEKLTEQQISSVLPPRYTRLIKSIKENGRRALLYILCTKVVIALIIEVPLDKYFIGHIDYTALAFNIIVPPLLLWFILSRSFKLDGANTKRIVSSATSMIKGEYKPITLPASAAVTEVSIGAIAFNGFFYAITFSIIIGLLVSLNFHAVSIILFLMFLALVSYFGNRVRSSASRWHNDDYKKNTLSHIATLFVFPIRRLGKWLSESFSTFNFFVFFLDMIIETPFKLVLSEFNVVMNFVRDKAEDVF